MKKAFIIIGLVCSLVVVGCGKKTEMKEVGKSDQITEDQSANDEEIGEESNDEKSSGESKTSSFELVEPTEEIKNSKVTDEIVQIGNVVLPNDLSLTVGQAMELLQKDGEVVLKEEDENESVGPLRTEKIVLIRPLNDNPDRNPESYWLCGLDIYNDSEESKSIKDCLILNIYHTLELPHNLNFFYAGGVNGVEQILDDRHKYFEEYKDVVNQRWNEYPYREMTTDQAREMARKMAQDAGLECEESDTQFVMYHTSPEVLNNYNKKYDNDEQYHRYFKYQFAVNLAGDNMFNNFFNDYEIMSEYEIELNERRKNN